MKHRSIIVHVAWDDEAGVWVATSGDIDGLAVEGETIGILEPKIYAAIRDLLELNGIDSDLAEIPVHLMMEKIGRVPNPSFDTSFA
jgi:hypothetical protein